jgi:hypothetical protein
MLIISQSVNIFYKVERSFPYIIQAIMLQIATRNSKPRQNYGNLPYRPKQFPIPISRLIPIFFGEDKTIAHLDVSGRQVFPPPVPPVCRLRPERFGDQASLFATYFVMAPRP